jgi:hypothetical protein
MASNSKEGQGPQRAVVPVMMMMMKTPYVIGFNKDDLLLLIYNHLPLNITLLSNDVKNFKSLFRSYLTEHAFVALMNFTKQLPNEYCYII